jgi:hypothetical protein
MRKNSIRLSIVLAISLICYNAVYFEKLSTKTNSNGLTINFNKVAQNLYQDVLKINSVAIEGIQNEFSENPENAIKKHGNRLGIGSSAYTMASLEGILKSKNSKELIITNSEGKDFKIDLLYIFGNSIRDASKLVKLTDYKKTSEFNSLSEALNLIIREKEIPKSVAILKIGDKVNAKVVFKISKEITDFSKLVFVPVSIQSIN